MNKLKLPRRSHSRPMPARGLQEMAVRFPDGPVKRAVTTAAGTYAGIVEGCDRISNDKTLNDGARLVRAAGFARSKLTGTLAAISHARTLAEESRQALIKEMNAPYDMTNRSFADVSLAGEVRTMIRQTPKRERVQLFMDLAAQKDLTVLTAVAAAPPALSGLAPDHHAVARQTVSALMFPEEQAQLETLNDTLELADSFETAMLQGVADCVDFETADAYESTATEAA